MKTQFVLSLIIGLCIIYLISSCSNRKVKNPNYEELYNASLLVIDDKQNEIYFLKDSLSSQKQIIDEYVDMLAVYSQKIDILKDSLDLYREDALVYKYKIERIKAYDNIVKNNSSQSKFFLGWVRRVIKD